MSKILGIDAGTNSTGWAIRDTSLADNQIIDYGVITFEKGVASEKGNEFPKVQKRTESRGKRHNYQAEKYRKWEVLEFLIERKMCPLTIEELDNWKKYTKGEKRKYPQSEAFINWVRFDFNGDGKPDFHLFGRDEHESYYIFRSKAIENESIQVFRTNPMILGRVFYQLVQRRGFRGRDEKEAETIVKGSEKSGTEGREKIEDYIVKYKSLGSALYHYQKEKGGRIRQRYNLRKDYENELKLICETHNITEEEYKKLNRAIIWQRPLRTQRGLIGSCIYETNKKRAPISHPLYEEYRTWVFINNLKIEVPEGIDKIQYLKDKIYPIFFKSSSDFELSAILKQLNKDGAKINSNFNEHTKVLSVRLLKLFQDVLGEEWKSEYGWNDIHDRKPKPDKKTTSSYTFEDIWHVLNTFDGQENLLAFATDKLRLSAENAEKFSKIKLNQGYATLSLSAIKKILPFLQKGFIYSHAVYLANIYKVLNHEEISDSLISEISDEIERITRNNTEHKLLNTIVNALIQDQLNSEYRYSVDLERNLDSSELAEIKAKIISIIGERTWSSFTEDKKELTQEYVAKNYLDFLKKSILSKRNVFIEQPRLHDEIFTFLKRKYNVPDQQKKYLWHPSEQENYASATEYKHYTLGKQDIFISEEKIQHFLANNPHAEYQGWSLRLLGTPEPLSKGLRNPMALKSLHKIKQLINYLLQTGKIDEDTRIVVEIARELNDANRRKAIERWNRDREKENLKFKGIIREINTECKTAFDENDKVLLQKVRLWEEQKRRCIYTGHTIGFCDVFNGTRFDIEHTIPASMSFDNELKNFTLAHSKYNRDVKGKLFPTQCSNYNEAKLINDIQCGSIIKNMEILFGKHWTEEKLIKGKTVTLEHWAKIDDLEKQYDEWRNKAKFASTKAYKDICIQNYHYVKMDLDYWRTKLKYFTIEEYKAGWRNSQLKDTQIITKFALPYLQTVFKKVSVEKGIVTDAFKEIYNVKLSDQKKDRSVHSHHAIDAAILTLIPPFYERDKILLKYNESKDDKYSIYHDKPIDWPNFDASKIKFIENNLLVNNLSENRTLVPTFKKVRTRGKIEYLRFLDENNRWQFRLDDKGNKIPKIAQGDTIRGQLHGESFYGAIKQPIRNEENKIVFDENRKMVLKDEIFLVIRKDLKYKKDENSSGFKSLEEIEKVIVDKDLIASIKKQVEAYGDFRLAMDNGIYMLDKKGNLVNKIRHIRCFENGIKYGTAIEVHTHSFKSRKKYKHFTLAKNGENSLCLFYKENENKAMRILSIGEVANLKIRNDNHYFNEPYYNQFEIGSGKKMTKIPLYAVLRVGQKVLFYNKLQEELLDLNTNELTKRMFKITQFESDGRIKFKHHLAAGIDTDLKKENKEFSNVNIDENQLFLRLRKKEWNFAIDGVDFEMKIDGEIHFNF